MFQPRWKRPTWPELAAGPMARNRRCQLARGAALAARRYGFAEMEVGHITRAAQTSGATFYRHFADKAECVSWGCEEGARKLFGPCERAGTDGGPWPARVEAGVGGLLAAATTDPLLAELCLVHSRALPGQRPPARDRGVDSLAALLAAGGRAGPRSAGTQPSCSGPGPKAAELLAGAIVAVIGRRLRCVRTDALAQLHDELIELALRGMAYPPECLVPDQPETASFHTFACRSEAPGESSARF